MTFSYYGSGPTLTPTEISQKYYKMIYTASQVLVSFQTNQASKDSFPLLFYNINEALNFFVSDANLH